MQKDKQEVNPAEFVIHTHARTHSNTHAHMHTDVRSHTHIYTYLRESDKNIYKRPSDEGDFHASFQDEDQTFKARPQTAYA